MADPFSLAFEGANFASALNDMAEDVEDEDIPTFLRQVMFDLLLDIIDKNPVDTGRSRAAWTPYLREHGIRTGAGPPENASDGDFTEELGDGPVQFIEVVNGVEYIVKLEFGHSSQAPAGMVRVSMREIAAGGDLTDTLKNEIATTFARANLTKQGYPS